MVAKLDSRLTELDAENSVQLWAISPFSRLGMRICGGQLTRRCFFLGPFGVSLLPMIVFTVWFVQGSLSDSKNTFQSGPFTWAIPAASLWILLGPSLMALGERGFGKVISELNRTANDGWPLGKLVMATQFVNRIAWLIVAPFTALTLLAYFLAGEWLETNLDVGSRFSLSWWAGLVVVTHIGHVSGWGVWGVVKALTLTWIVTLPANYKTQSRTLQTLLPPWTPFRSDQVPGIEAIATFSINTAFLFSAGSVLAPAIALAAGDVSAIASITLWLTVLILVFGSTALFVIPAVWISRLTRWQKTEYLKNLTSRYQLSRLADSKLEELSTESIGKMDLGIKLIDFANRQPALPDSFQTFRRLPLAVFIPALSIAGTVAGLFRS